MNPAFSNTARIWTLPVLVLHFAFFLAMAHAEKQTFPIQTGKPIGDAVVTKDPEASSGQTIRLQKLDQGVTFDNVPAGKKLAIRYASVDAGTLSVLVNGKPARRVYVHSSGSLTGSFLNAVIELDIPAGATVTIVRLAGDPAVVDPDKSQWLIDGKWQPWTGDVGVAIESITVGDDLGLPPDIWNLPALKPAAGPYPADWKGLAQKYVAPAWWRDAKFGAWAHWDPQSMPEQGDWYSRNIYIQGKPDYEFHIKNFGHPSEYGYKEVCRDWKIDRWNPDELMDLFVEMGARYFVAMGVHHDNFDCWDSAYQPWNALRVGPKRDVVGTWEKLARAKGLRFGIGFHHSPGRTWGQFMQVRYTADKTGPKVGVPYDAMMTILDGKGKWWEGMDPVDLYGYPHRGNEVRNSPFANQFMWRVDDAISKYHPDLIYFDEHAGEDSIDLGIHMGLGFLAPTLSANYYNKSLGWNDGKMEVVLNLKGVGGVYNSFSNHMELLPFVDRSLVKSTEAKVEKEITAYPFQTETSISEWHYKTGQKYIPADGLVKRLIENVCRNGTMLLNITQHGRGDLDPEAVTACKEVGAWLKVNGEAIYGSRPFEVFGEQNIRYTRNKGFVFATVMDWPAGNRLHMPSLRAGGATLGKITKVELLGSAVPLTFHQDENGMDVVAGETPKTPLDGGKNPSLAAIRVLKITHDKPWVSDDDPGTVAPGWQRVCNLGAGDYNNDLTTSEISGDAMTFTTTSTTVTVICPKEKGAGKIEILADGESQGIFDLSTEGPRLPQQRICTIRDLPSGPDHVIKVVNRGGRVAVDAFVTE